MLCIREACLWAAIYENNVTNAGLRLSMLPDLAPQLDRQLREQRELSVFDIGLLSTGASRR